VIEAIWQRIAFGGFYTAKGITFDPKPITPKDSDTGCRKPRIYTDDCYHPEKLF
jgi:hypothetical protein